MTLLVLGNSAFLPRKGLKDSELPQNRPDASVDAAIGGELARIVKIAWPTPKLPELVTAWIDETKPDAILFVINEFWFNYRSVPELVSRKFGPFGLPISRVGSWAGRNPRLAYSRAFQRARKFTEEKVGADAHFEPDEVIAVSLDVLRRITRAEGPVPLVLGPMGSLDALLPLKLRAEGEQRRVKVHQALKQFCDASHIEYWGLDSRIAEERPKGLSKLADGIHSDSAGMKTSLDYWGPLVAKFLIKVKEDADQRRP